MGPCCKVGALWVSPRVLARRVVSAEGFHTNLSTQQSNTAGRVCRLAGPLLLRATLVLTRD